MNGKCLRQADISVTQSEAVTYCSDRGGELLQVTNQNDFSWRSKMISQYGANFPIWLDGYHDGAAWRSGGFSYYSDGHASNTGYWRKYRQTDKFLLLVVQ